jgi:hypothetical protein
MNLYVYKAVGLDYDGLIVLFAETEEQALDVLSKVTYEDVWPDSLGYYMKHPDVGQTKMIDLCRWTLFKVHTVEGIHIPRFIAGAFHSG